MMLRLQIIAGQIVNDVHLQEVFLIEDPRCCGTGTCLINSDGQCWCGQQWDGEKMCFQNLTGTTVDQSSVAHDPNTLSAPD